MMIIILEGTLMKLIKVESFRNWEFGKVKALKSNQEVYVLKGYLKDLTYILIERFESQVNINQIFTKQEERNKGYATRALKLLFKTLEEDITVDSVFVDFENFSFGLQEKYSQFIQALCEELDIKYYKEDCFITYLLDIRSCKEGKLGKLKKLKVKQIQSKA